MKASIFQRLKLAGRALSGKLSQRSFAGADVNRLTSDWGTTVTSADAESRNDLGTLRTRCRQLERDNDYFARFLNLLDNNIIGSEGVALHMHITDPNGELD